MNKLLLGLTYAEASFHMTSYNSARLSDAIDAVHNRDFPAQFKLLGDVIDSIEVGKPLSDKMVALKRIHKQSRCTDPEFVKAASALVDLNEGQEKEVAAIMETYNQEMSGLILTR